MARSVPAFLQSAGTVALAECEAITLTFHSIASLSFHHLLSENDIHQFVPCSTPAQAHTLPSSSLTTSFSPEGS